MAAVRKGSGATARRRIRGAVQKAAASIEETNGATNGATTDGAAHREADIETVRVRAYQIFLARGATHGDDLADWFRAEEEVRGANNP